MGPIARLDALDMRRMSPNPPVKYQTQSFIFKRSYIFRSAKSIISVSKVLHVSR